MARLCTACGVALGDEDRFCTSCGEPASILHPDRLVREDPPDASAMGSKVDRLLQSDPSSFGSSGTSDALCRFCAAPLGVDDQFCTSCGSAGSQAQTTDAQERSGPGVDRVLDPQATMHVAGIGDGGSGGVGEPAIRRHWPRRVGVALAGVGLAGLVGGGALLFLTDVGGWSIHSRGQEAHESEAGQLDRAATPAESSNGANLSPIPMVEVAAASGAAPFCAELAKSRALRRLESALVDFVGSPERQEVILEAAQDLSEISARMSPPAASAARSASEALAELVHDDPPSAETAMDASEALIQLGKEVSECGFVESSS